MSSIIIVSFNTCQLTRNCLLSLREHEPDSEVIVVDNASHDGSPDMIRNEFPEVKFVALEENVGFGRANNAGYEHATHDTVVLLNSDTVLSDGALTRCEGHLKANPDVGVVSPGLMGVDGVPQQCRHRFPTIGDVIRKAFRMKTAPVDGVPDDWSWLAGTCLVLRREAIEKAGGLFDHELFMYWEDADLSSRLITSGWKLLVADDATITHYGGASGGGPDAARRPDLDAWYTFGRHYWFSKHRPLWESLTLWLMEFMDAFRCLLRGAIHSDRRNEWVRAGTMFRVLTRRLVGMKPKSI